MSPPRSPRGDGELLGAAIKAVRRHRAMTTAQTAEAMNMALRTYERLEAGRGRFNLEHVYRFAAATDCDPGALITAVTIGSPEFAVRCADNKLISILTVALQDFDDAMHDRIRALEARSLIMAFGETFSALEDQSRRQEEATADWLDAGRQRLSARRPKPGR